MKNSLQVITLTLFTGIIAIAFISLGCNDRPVDQIVSDTPVCQSDEENTVDQDTEDIHKQDTGEKLSIDVNLDTEIAHDPDHPDWVLFTIQLNNPQLVSADEMIVNLIYEADHLTGETTYLLEDPMDEESELISDENGPVLFSVTETEHGRVEDYARQGQDIQAFNVELPVDTVRVRYKAEIIIVNEANETVFIETPTTTQDMVALQDGIIDSE